MKSNNITNLLKQNVIIIAFLALFIMFSLLSDAFFATTNLLNVTRQVSFMGIASVGMMMVILTGGIDLSVGSLVQLVNVLCAMLIVNAGLPWGLAVLICFAVALTSGLINGLLITKAHIPPLIVTIASMHALSGFAFILSGGRSIFGFPDSFGFIGQGHILGVPVPTIVMTVIFIITAFFLKRTFTGRCLYAIGGNEEAARLSGIDTDRVKIMAYMSSSFLSCLAGIMMLSRLFSGTANTGRGFEFEVLTAVVLGGVSISGGYGRVVSVVFGVLIIGILSNGLILLNVNTFWQNVVNGVVLASAVWIDMASRNRKIKASAV